MPQYKRIKQKLLNRLDELTRRAEDNLSSIGSAGGDNADIAFTSSSVDIMSNVASHNANEVEQIVDTLARIDSGTFGICVECKQKIAIARLQAKPYASMCIDCQRNSE